MEHFIKYMDRIIAKEELKDKTKYYILYHTKAADSVIEASFMKNRAVGHSFFKKGILVGLSTIAACLVLAIGGYSYYSNPVSFVSFDINPSVELGINTFNRVVSAEGINEDGETLLDQFNAVNLSLENAAEVLVRKAALSGYIAGDGSSVIAINVQSASEDKALELQKIVSDKIVTILDDLNTDAILFADTATLKQRTEARKMGISAGKYKVLLYMENLDPAISFEQYHHRHFPELIEEANDLIFQSDTGGIQANDYEQTRQMVISTNREINEIKTVEQDQLLQHNKNQPVITDEDQDLKTEEHTESTDDTGKYQETNQNNKGDGRK